MPNKIHPFPGLRPFKTEEQYLFFGREGQSEEVISRLRKRRFLALIGTSGSGKSSLIRAGLLPYLYGGFMAEAGSRWRVATLRPGTDPIGRLARALNDRQVLGFNNPETEDVVRNEMLLEVTLRRSGLGLIEAVKLARLPEQENLIIVVDQLEELFRFEKAALSFREQDDAAAFIKLLLEATHQSIFPIYVVVAIRSDFIGDCARFRKLPEAVTSSPYLIPWMDREQQRSAITDPIQVAGATISPRLSNRLLSDAGDNPDQLPILQHALMRTWDFFCHHPNEENTVDLEHYLAVGGMEEALSRHANEAYDELPDEPSRIIAKKMFQALTEKGADKRGIRHPAKITTIAAITEADIAQVTAVAEHFSRKGRGFVLSHEAACSESADDIVLDISHESLINGWDRLRNWVDEEFESARTYKRLADRATEHEKGNAALMTNPDLQKTVEWKELTKPNIAWAQRYDPAFDRAIKFLEQSQAADIARQDKAVREQRAETQRKTEELGRARSNLRKLAYVCGVAFLLACTAAYLLYKTMHEAKNAALSEDRATENERDALAFAVRTLDALSNLIAMQKSQPAAPSLPTKTAGQQATAKAYEGIYKSANQLSEGILRGDPGNPEAQRLNAASIAYYDHLFLANAAADPERRAALFHECQQRVRSASTPSANNDVHRMVPEILLLASSADIFLELGSRADSMSTAELAIQRLNHALKQPVPDAFTETEWQILLTSSSAIRGVLEGKSHWDDTHQLFSRMEDQDTRSAPEGISRSFASVKKLTIHDSGSTAASGEESQNNPTKLSLNLISEMIRMSVLEKDSPDRAVEILNTADSLAERILVVDDNTENGLFLENLQLADGYISAATNGPKDRPSATTDQLFSKSQNSIERARIATRSTNEYLVKVFREGVVLDALGNLDVNRARRDTNETLKISHLQEALRYHQNGISRVKPMSSSVNYLLATFYCDLGRDLLLLGQTTHAEDTFREATTLVPLSQEALGKMNANDQQDYLDEAIAIYTKIAGTYAFEREFDHGGHSGDTALRSERDWTDKAVAAILTLRMETKDIKRQQYLDTKLALLYGGRSWDDLLLGQFQGAVTDAQLGYSRDHSQVWILTNEAHGYLFQGRVKTAARIYEANLDREANDGENHTFREAVLQDFVTFRENKYPQMNLEYLKPIEDDVRTK
jgi:hypothetical protein